MRLTTLWTRACIVMALAPSLAACVSDEGVAKPSVEATAMVTDLRGALGAGPALVPTTSPVTGRTSAATARPRHPAEAIAATAASQMPGPAGPVRMASAEVTPQMAAQAAAAAAALEGAPIVAATPVAPPAATPPAAAEAYAPVVAQNTQVDRLMSILNPKGGGAALVPRRGAIEAPAPAPSGPAVADPADGPRQGAAGVEARIPPPPTTTVTLAAPGMVVPDPRVRDAIERQRQNVNTTRQGPGDQRNIDDLF